MDKIIKLGLIKETKTPEDNRVLFTPLQVKKLVDTYNNIEIYVQSCDIRAFKDDEYRILGIPVVEDISHCDILLGIKEVAIDQLIPNKHYFFFGHIAKMQSYNKPLIKELIRKKITFSDYEYLTNDKGVRICAFGWWAGFVGVYNSLRAYGLKTQEYRLNDALDLETTVDLVNEVKSKVRELPSLVVTGNGKVTEGALDFIKSLEYYECTTSEYFGNNNLKNKYLHLLLPELVKHVDEDKNFDRLEFKEYPNRYVSNFNQYYSLCDVFIPCHFWGANDPIYLSEDDISNPNFMIKVIGDVTCDISGGIKSTIRPSTHKEPFYDINRDDLKENTLFEDSDSLTVMAVDTLPNALPRAASEYFGDKFIENVMSELLNMLILSKDSKMVCDATILNKGVLTDKYQYLTDYAK